MLWAMIGGNGIPVPSSLAPTLSAVGLPISRAGLFPHGAFDPSGLMIIASLTLIALFAPNVMQLFARFQPTVEQPAAALRWIWRPMPATAVGVGLLFALAILMLSGESPFLYFRF